MKLKCIINGHPLDVETKPTEMVLAVRLRALLAAQATGRPPADFDIRGAAGNYIFPTFTVEELGLKDGDTLWISPAIGCGGSNKINHRRTRQRFRVEHDKINHTHWWQRVIGEYRRYIRQVLRVALLRSIPPADDGDSDAHFVTLRLRQRCYNSLHNRWGRLQREKYLLQLKGA